MKLLLILRAQMGNEERKSKSINGQKARIMAGDYPYMPKQGYVTGALPCSRVPDPKRFSKLQEARKKIIHCGYTPSEALDWLHKKGYKTPNNKKLRIDKFMNMLRDPFFAGVTIIKGNSIKMANKNAKHKSRERK